MRSRLSKELFPAILFCCFLPLAQASDRYSFDILYQSARIDGNYLLILKKGRVFRAPNRVNSLSSGSSLFRLGALFTLFDLRGEEEPILTSTIDFEKNAARFRRVIDAQIMADSGAIYILGEEVVRNPPTLYQQELAPDWKFSQNHYFIQKINFTETQTTPLSFTLDGLARPKFAQDTKSSGYLTFVQDYRVPTKFAALADGTFLVAVEFLGINSLRQVEIYKIRPTSDGDVEMVESFGYKGRVVLDDMEVLDGITPTQKQDAVWLHTSSGAIYSGGILKTSLLDIQGSSAALPLIDIELDSFGGVYGQIVNPESEKLFYVGKSTKGRSGFFIERYDVSSRATGQAEKTVPLIKTDLDFLQTVELASGPGGGFTLVGRNKLTERRNELLVVTMDENLNLVQTRAFPDVFVPQNYRNSCVDHLLAWKKSFFKHLGE